MEEDTVSNMKRINENNFLEEEHQITQKSLETIIFEVLLRNYGVKTGIVNNWECRLNRIIYHN